MYKSAKDRTYGWIGQPLPPELIRRVRMVQAMIKPEDIIEDGIEREPHVTLAYGLTQDEPAILQRALQHGKPGMATMQDVGVFDQPDYRVLHMQVGGDSARNLHDIIRTKVGMPGFTHPEYNPHVTLAYLKKGVDDTQYRKYASLLSGHEFPITAPRFRNRRSGLYTLRPGQEVNKDELALALARIARINKEKQRQ